MVHFVIIRSEEGADELESSGFADEGKKEVIGGEVKDIDGLVIVINRVEEMRDGDDIKRRRGKGRVQEREKSETGGGIGREGAMEAERREGAGDDDEELLIRIRVIRRVIERRRKQEGARTFRRHLSQRDPKKRVKRMKKRPKGKRTILLRRKKRQTGEKRGQVWGEKERVGFSGEGDFHH